MKRRGSYVEVGTPQPLRASIGHPGCRLRHSNFDQVRDCEASQRARSTLTLLSRVAVFMWMEASVNWNDFTDEPDHTIFDNRYAPRMSARRANKLVWAIHRGLLSVDWGSR